MWLPIATLACGGTWLIHCVELRTDILTTPLTLLALGLLWARPRRRWTFPFAVAAVAAAVLISQKSAYNTLGLAFAWLLAAPTADPSQPGPAGRLRDVGRALGLGAALLVLWYLLMALLSGLGTDFVSRNMDNAMRTAFGGGVSQGEKLTWLQEALRRGPLLLGVRLARALPGPSPTSQRWTSARLALRRVHDDCGSAHPSRLVSLLYRVDRAVSRAPSGALSLDRCPGDRSGPSTRPTPRSRPPLRAGRRALASEAPR